jgi:hypothetical protein
VVNKEQTSEGIWLKIIGRRNNMHKEEEIIINNIQDQRIDIRNTDNLPEEADGLQKEKEEAMMPRVHWLNVCC